MKQVVSILIGKNAYGCLDNIFHVLKNRERYERGRYPISGCRKM